MVSPSCPEHGHYATPHNAAREDHSPEHAGYFDSAYLDARHGLPALPPSRIEAQPAYLDGYHTGEHWHETQRPASIAAHASTDGKIIGLCPGCNHAIRRHDTPHGDELRHLHNNSVRCHGSAKEAFLPLLAEEAAAGVEGAAAGGAGLADKAETADNVGKGVGEALKPLTGPGNNWAYKAQGFEASLQHQAGDYLGRPDASNPTGRGPDEYKARTWDAYQTTRPMQSPDDRGVNTPVLPAEPIRTRQVNSPNPGESLSRNDRLQVTRDEDEEEE